MRVDNMLTAHPDLNGIWAAWDQAAIEATLAVMAAQRTDMFVTGIDGGKPALRGTSSPARHFFFTRRAELLSGKLCRRSTVAHEYLAGRQLYLA